MLNGTIRQANENGKDYAYRVIRHNIMNLTLEPGRAISEIDLAEALQLSRTPVREVMSRLKEEYLVDVIPQVGTYISKIDAQLIEEAAFMRFVLEKEILALACRTFSSDTLLELTYNMKKQELLLEQAHLVHGEQAVAFHELDNAFHRLLFRGCGKEHVWDSIVRLSTHYNRMRLLFESEYSFAGAVQQHALMVKRITDAQVEGAESLIREHILEPIRHWEEQLGNDERYMAYFKSSDVFHISFPE